MTVVHAEILQSYERHKIWLRNSRYQVGVWWSLWTDCIRFWGARLVSCFYLWVESDSNNHTCVATSCTAINFLFSVRTLIEHLQLSFMRMMKMGIDKKTHSTPNRKNGSLYPPTCMECNWLLAIGMARVNFLLSLSFFIGWTTDNTIRDWLFRLACSYPVTCKAISSLLIPIILEDVLYWKLQSFVAFL